MPAHWYRFDEFELDGARFELRRNGKTLKLERIPLELLILLAEKNGQVVTRQEIIDRLWGQDVFVDTEHGINTAIRKVRTVLRDDAERPRFVQTVSGKGYRFVAELSNGNGAAGKVLATPETRPLTQNEESPTPVAAPAEKYRPWKLVSASAFVLLWFGVAYWVMSSPPMPRIVRSYALTKTGIRKTPEFQSRVLTDGISVYFQEDRPSHIATMRMPIAGGEAIEVPGAVEGALSDISPDGSQALFDVPTIAGYDALIQALPAGTPRLLVKDARFPTWTADGQRVLFARRNDKELWRVNADGTSTQRLAEVPDISGIAVSPDGERIRLTDWTSQTLWETGPDWTNAKAVLTEADSKGRWSPDGKYFFFSRSDADQVNLYVRSEERHWWRRNPPLRQLTFGPLSIFPPAISKDGKHLYARGKEAHGELSVHDQHTGAFAPYLGGMPACYVDFSRDGQWIAYMSYPEGTLWRSRLDGSERRQLTVPPMLVANPRWSPDGKLIAFWDMRRLAMHMYVVSTEGGGPMLLPANGQNPADPTWSPDGKSIAYDARGGFSGKFHEIWILDLSTQKSSKVPGSDGLRSARWSPDGKYLAALGGDPSKLWLFSFETQQWSELASGNPAWPSWSRDSKFVYAELWGDASIVRVRISDRKVERIASLKGFPPAAVGFMGVTPDGRPIMTRDTGIEEVYAFDLEYK